MQIANKKPKQHIQILDFLRGIAALAVVIFHFATSTLPTIKPNLLGDYFSHGNLGVKVFFVISGFVIPYAMYSSGYHIKNFFNFIIRRLARIGPPSWVAILLMAGVYFGGIWLNGRPIEGMHWPGISFRTILANLTYSYSLLDTKAYIDVYWTLEVEFQYYLMIGLLLPLITRYAANKWVLSGILLLLSATFVVHNNLILFFRDNSFFILGILLYLYKTEQINRNYFINASFVAIMICYGQQGATNSFAAFITFLVIAYVHYENPVTTFLGRISYSLYITHLFSGIVSEFVLRNLTGMEPSEGVKVFMLFVYTGIAVAFAWVFYLLVEKPFIRFSHRFKLKKNDPQKDVVPVNAPASPLRS